jgi:signal peptidase I
MEIVKKTLGVVWDFLESITFALAIFVVVYLFLFQPSVVLGTSSYPTIRPEDKVISEKISYLLHPPQRGDFVILQSPVNNDVDFVKRIVGLPGERLKILNGNVYINGDILDEPYLQAGVFTDSKSYLSENQEIEIPMGQFFVMGDNREHSSDSRDFGPVPQGNIVGHVVFRFWPLDRTGVVN